jgi:hypothetical protein
MPKADELKAEIERLPSEEFAELSRWLLENDWERWDAKIEADSETGARGSFASRRKLEIRPRKEALRVPSKETNASQFMKYMGPVANAMQGRFRPTK